MNFSGWCFLNDIENLLKSIFDKALHWDKQVNKYSKYLLKETTKFNDILIDSVKNINKYQQISLSKN